MFLYEGLWVLVSGLARFIGLLSAKVGAQLLVRDQALTLLPSWARLRSRYPRCVLFVCSSAGEYEQAKPLIKRWSARGDTALFILFFSPSGIKFATSQKESVPFALVASDKPSYWREVAAQLRPDACIFVRYELWPGMVGTLSQFSPLYLIDGVEAPHLRRKRLARRLRAALIKPMKNIFVVNDNDKIFYENVLGYAPNLIQTTGDTKYDRVLERISERSEALERLQTSLRDFLKNRRVIVIGSAWPRDLQEFMSCYQDLKAFDPSIAVIVAPHDLSESNVSTMQKMLEGLRVRRVSQSGYEGASSIDDILLVDVLGDLPELYGCAHLAWVGGAMHYRVHNVLEPACRGLYVCFGPQYQTSQEAKALVQRELARVIHNGLEFFQWYKNLVWTTTPPHQAMWQAVVEQKGASDRIIHEITRAWTSQ
ncbi:MAG: hypothetical protein H7249_02775 [Chitinophagaceae bacterium]|nr:hypothetical protein [Oligoflexus sp.]